MTGKNMNFDTWMRARNPKYHPTDDTVALRELRECWRTAEWHIELMRDKCRKVGAGDTALDIHADLTLHALRREVAK
jgi:hypothetical protein